MAGKWAMCNGQTRMHHTTTHERQRMESTHGATTAFFFSLVHSKCHLRVIIGNVRGFIGIISEHPIQHTLCPLLHTHFRRAAPLCSQCRTDLNRESSENMYARSRASRDSCRLDVCADACIGSQSVSTRGSVVSGHHFQAGAPCPTSPHSNQGQGSSRNTALCL
jgi:hypothetical protein